jgi:stearoyl-CoA desaturase (Delta-9 desaturase)
VTSAVVERTRPNPNDKEIERPASPAGFWNQVVTILVVFGPLAGTVLGLIVLFHREITLADWIIAIVMYLITGHGLTAGYHRMCTHRAFTATRATKLALIIAGSLGFEGGVIGWSGNHRLHHAYTDVDGDPHSPHLSGSRFRGALHAHVGWLFFPPVDERQRWVPDLCADRDLVVLDKLFPFFCLVSLGLPTLVGFLVTGTAAGAIGGFLVGGLARVFILQQATFAVNSACHIWGKRPFATRKADEARNFAPIAVFSMGDNWHNLHHSMPRLARHGVGRHQWDSTARLIWVLERLRLVSAVRWPDAVVLAARRRPALDQG